MQTPTTKIETKVLESLKAKFNIEKNLTNIKNKYRNFIEAFDTSQKDLVKVTYWKKEIPEDIVADEKNPDWGYVR